MLVSQKQPDTEILIKDPAQLLVTFQGLIEIIVMKFVRSGGFSYSEKMDIIQTINEKLLLKIPRIKDQYKGISTLRSYLAVIVQNICIEILRKKKHIVKEEIETVKLADDRAISPQNSLIIQQEIQRLKRAIELYFKQKDKLVLSLKLKFRIPFDFGDFNKYSNRISKEEFTGFKNEIASYIDSTDLHIYQALIKIFNKQENKKNTSDSLRKWVSLKISELIKFLNGDPPTSNYTEETLQILFEKYVNLVHHEVTTIEPN